MFLITTDDIIVCDPEGEYFSLVQRLKGQVIKISPTSSQYINPMDINLNYSEDDSPLALKSDFILSLCELIVGGKDGLIPVEKSIIDRCVTLVYAEYLADPDHAKMPILGDLYDALGRQEEKEAKHIRSALEIYVTGSLSVFNHQTNVDIQNRLICFDIKELGKQLKNARPSLEQSNGKSCGKTLYLLLYGRVSLSFERGRNCRLFSRYLETLS